MPKINGNNVNVNIPTTNNDRVQTGKTVCNTIENVGSAFKTASYIPGPHQFFSKIFGSTLSAKGAAGNAGINAGQGNKLDTVADLMVSAGNLGGIIPTPQTRIGGAILSGMGTAIRNREQISQTLSNIDFTQVPKFDQLD